MNKEIRYIPTGDLTNKAYINSEGRIVFRNLWGSDGRGFFPCDY